MQVRQPLLWQLRFWEIISKIEILKTERHLVTRGIRLSLIDRRSSKRLDWIFLTLILLLTVLGLANLYSATYDQGAPGLAPIFRRQLFALSAALTALVVVALIDYRKLERFSGFIFVGTLILLASTLVFSPLIQGNRSWLLYGSFSVQPSEFAKLIAILVIAAVLDGHQIRQPVQLFKPLIHQLENLI